MSHPVPYTSILLLGAVGVGACGAASAIFHGVYLTIDKSRNFSPATDAASAALGVVLLSALASVAGWHVAVELHDIGPRLSAIVCGIGGLTAPALYTGALKVARKLIAKSAA